MNGPTIVLPRDSLAIVAERILHAPILEMMKHKDSLPEVDLKTKLGSVIQKMSAKGSGVAFVTLRGQLWGILTERDVLTHVGRPLMNSTSNQDADAIGRVLESPVEMYAVRDPESVEVRLNGLCAVRTFLLGGDPYRRLGVYRSELNANDREVGREFVGAVTFWSVLEYLNELLLSVKEEHLANLSCPVTFSKTLMEVSQLTDVRELEPVTGCGAQTPLKLEDGQLACVAKVLFDRTVGSIMRPLSEVPVFSPDTRLPDVINSLEGGKKPYGYAFIGKKQRSEYGRLSGPREIVGTFTESDLVRMIGNAVADLGDNYDSYVTYLGASVGAVRANRTVITVTENTSLLSAIRLMCNSGVRRLPVMRYNPQSGTDEIYGAISHRTILEKLFDTLDREYTSGNTGSRSADRSAGPGFT